MKVQQEQPELVMMEQVPLAWKPFGLAEAHLKVIGMYCLPCKSVVEKQLKVESGIQRIDIDYVTANVAVKLDGSLVITKERN